MHLIRISLKTLMTVSLACLPACKSSPDDQSTKKETSETHSSRSYTSSDAKSQRRSRTADRVTNRKPAETFSLESLQKQLSRMSAEDLILHQHEIRQLLLAHPEQAKAIFAQYTNQLFQDNPTDALNFALTHGNLLADGSGDQITTELLQTWNKNDTPAFQAYLDTLAKHHNGMEIECNHALRLLILGEQKDFNPSNWITWIDQLPKGQENQGELQGAALNAMLSIVDPQNSDHLNLLVEAYQKRVNDKGLQKHLPGLARIIAKHKPEESQRLLETMPGGTYREQVLEQTIAELGRSHPEIGAEWLSSQDVLTKIFRPEFDTWKTQALSQGIQSPQLQEAEKAFQAHVDHVYDKTLTTYIFSIVHKNPKDAMANVDVLIDPNRRENLRKKIQAIIDAMPTK